MTLIDYHYEGKYIVCKKAAEDLKSNAPDLREGHLEERAEFYAEQHNREYEMILREIKNSESIHNTLKHVRWNIKCFQENSLNRIIVKDGEALRTITDAEEIFTCILDNNKNIMQSLRDTIPASRQFSQIFGDCGESEACVKAVNAELVESKLPFDSTTNEWIKALRQPITPHTKEGYIMDAEVSAQEVKKLFRNTKEFTASSPSGIHMGYYKAASYSDKLCEILEILMYLPFMHGFSPERWNQSTHLMLEKVPGFPLVSNLRLTQLLEEDFNRYLKIKIGRGFRTIIICCFFQLLDLQGTQCRY